MKNLKNKELEQFMKHHEAEVDQATKDFEKAKLEYEKIMKNFVINHITSKKRFKSSFEQAYENACSQYQDEDATDFIDDVIVLETMISDHMYWLEEGQFECQDD